MVIIVEYDFCFFFRNVDRIVVFKDGRVFLEGMFREVVRRVGEFLGFGIKLLYFFIFFYCFGFLLFFFLEEF